jgi:hypothetical protein
LPDIELTLVPWAPGTPVGAYPKRSELMLPEQPPTGVPPEHTEIVAADASLLYRGMIGGDYWAAAPLNGVWKYIAFTIEVPDYEAVAAVQSPDGRWHEITVEDDGRISSVDIGEYEPPHGPPPYVTLAEVADLEDASAEHEARLGNLAVNVKDPAYGAKGNGSADDTAAIQAALTTVEQAGGGHVYVPTGTYPITATLLVGSDTFLELHPDAVIKRNGPIQCMLRNREDGVTGGYNANARIRIQGGRFEANSTIPTPCDALFFGHMSDLTLRDITIRDTYAWHLCEVNGCKRVRVLNCTFLDSVILDKEMLQLDIQYAGSGFSGPGDNTANEDVLVNGCTFENGSVAIGNHVPVVGHPHSNIRVIGNRFKTMTQAGILLCDTNALLVANNQFEDITNWGCALQASKDAVSGFSVVGNQFRNIGGGDFVKDSRAIRPVGIATARIRDIAIVGNTLRSVGRYGITTEYCDYVEIVGNTITDTGRYGIFAIWATNVVVAGNNAVGNNIELPATYRDIQIGYTSGLVTESSGYIVTGNICGSMRVSYVEKCLVSGNYISTTYTDDNRGGTDVRVINNALPAIAETVASAATITLRPDMEFVVLSGSTPVTAITASWPKRRVTFRSTGSVTVTDGGNLNLAGNITLDSNDTLTLICDGTNWYETSRSTN